MDSQLRTLQKKRTTNFREDETKLLIQLWGSPVIQNKLYLTHRKAPVMRLLAANMQSRGFYRTPDEIKTRIRNLKCLYHRIKRTMASGAGIGTIDPDWPHYKTMDAILSKEGLRKITELPSSSMSDDGILEGPKCEDIKQEVDDLDINDDITSWQENESNASEYEEETPTLPVLNKAPPQRRETPIKPKMPTLVPSFSVPVTQAHTNQNIIRTTGPNGMPSIPLPLLILNSLQPQQSQAQIQDLNKFASVTSSSNEQKNKAGGAFNRFMPGHVVLKQMPQTIQPSPKIPDLNNILKDLVEVQKQALEIEKQKLEVEKQRLEFDRVVGSQLMTLVPMIGGVLQRLVYPPTTKEEDSSDGENVVLPERNSRKRPTEDSDFDILKDSKILRTVLERGIKKYMMEENSNDNKDSDNEDSGIHNDDDTNENSNASNK